MYLRDRTNSSGAVVEGVKDEDTEVDAVETTSEEEAVMAEVTSDDEATAIDAFSGEEVTVAEASTDEDSISMDKLEVAEATVAFANNSRSIERVSNEHIAAGTITSVVRAVETEVVAIASNGGTAQGNPSKSDSRTDPSLFDSSPATRHYARRAPQGSIVSIDSGRTISATPMVPTPLSPPRKYGGATPTPVVITVVVSIATTVQEDKTVPIAAKETPGSEEFPVQISDIPEGNVVEDTLVNENLVVGIDFGTGATQIGCAEAAASEIPVLADFLPGSDIPVVEGTFAQDSADDISTEDMADTYDRYDAVLAGIGDHVADTQAANLGVTTLAATHTSPTKIGNWFLISTLLFFCLMA